VEWLNELWQNRVLINGLIAWISAQVIKTVIYTVINKKIEFSRLFGDGGMPSGHSATVTAIAVTSAVKFGLSSFEFAVTAVLALIVMHDAMGVRLETGKQAKVINELRDFFLAMGNEVASKEKLKELVGHTPMQVFFGGALGLVLGLILSIQ
jgi:acid phosphatase family membrane protein YuiD